MDLDVVERYRRAQAYLEDGAPLAALRVLDPASDEIAATAEPDGCTLWVPDSTPVVTQANWPGW